MAIFLGFTLRTNPFVFADEVSEEELLKAQLGAEIFRILDERRLTQTEAAKLLGVKQPEISLQLPTTPGLKPPSFPTTVLSS